MVYAKPPFAGAEQVLEYVGRYTHRVAIANNRIVDIEDGKVRFRWKDYRNESRQKVMTLDAGEFIRRFLVHVLPEGFQRIRYYGFMGNRYRKQKLALCRELLGMKQSDKPVEPEGRARLSRQGRGTHRSFLAGMPLLPPRADVVHRGARARCVTRPKFSGHFMRVGIFQPLIIVRSICQGRQQASDRHACGIEPSRRRRRRLSDRENISRLECFTIQTASSMSPKPQRRHCPWRRDIQFP